MARPDRSEPAYHAGRRGVNSPGTNDNDCQLADARVASGACLARSRRMNCRTAHLECGDSSPLLSDATPEWHTAADLPVPLFVGDVGGKDRRPAIVRRRAKSGNELPHSKRDVWCGVVRKEAMNCRTSKGVAAASEVLRLRSGRRHAWGGFNARKGPFGRENGFCPGARGPLTHDLR